MHKIQNILWEIFFFIFFLQIEPLQSSFSVAALLGDKLQQKAKTNMNIKKSNNGTTRPGLPPTPQPSDSEEDEPLRKRRSMEQCELAKVSIDKEFFVLIFNYKTISFWFFLIVLIYYKTYVRMR